MAIVSRLALARFLINLGKTKFLVDEAPLLGVFIHRRCYCLGSKALKKLFATAMPTNLHELQALLGQLNFVSRLIPGYKRIVRPIEVLLKSTMQPLWT